MTKNTHELVPRRRPTTSSERGRAFRERERQRIEKLEQQVADLTRQIAEKTYLRGIWEAKYLRTRYTKYGSLTRFVEEYYTLVRYGVRKRSRGMEEKSTTADAIEFLSRVTHADAVLGEVVGPKGMIDQWQLYTAAHGRYETYVNDIDVRGPEDDPIVYARLHVTVRVTRKTLEMIFPHVLDDEALIQDLIGREITYMGATWVRFSQNQQIIMQDVRFDFIDGFLNAGIALQRVERLFRASRISPTSTILVEPVKANEYLSEIQE